MFLHFDIKCAKISVGESYELPAPYLRMCTLSVLCERKHDNSKKRAMTTKESNLVVSAVFEVANGYE